MFNAQWNPEWGWRCRFTGYFEVELGGMTSSAKFLSFDRAFSMEKVEAEG